MAKGGRALLHRRQGGICFYCEQPMTLALYTPLSVTRDHMVPLSRGGGVLGARNIVGACWSCNALKGDRTAAEFLADYADSIPAFHGQWNRFRRKLVARSDDGKLAVRAPQFGQSRHTGDRGPATFKLGEVWPEAGDA